MIEIINQKRDLTNLADVYAQVFAGPPWNEYTKCPNQQIYFGLETKPGESCPECDDALEAAYPNQDTVAYIQKELARPKSLGLVSLNKNRQIDGFSWSYAFRNPLEFANDKYKSELMRQRVESVLQDVGIKDEFYYFSETGLLETSRGRGKTNLFYAARLVMAWQNNLPVVVRTNLNSPIVAVTESFGFQQLIGPKVLANRQLKTVTANPEKADLLDLDNPERVLFARVSYK